MLPPASTRYRRPLLLGKLVSAYFASQPITRWMRHTHAQLQISIHLGSPHCEVTWWEHDETKTLTLAGPHVCFVAPGVPHALDWKREAVLIALFVERRYLRQLGLKNIKGVVAAPLSKFVNGDLAVWAVSEIFRELAHGA